MKSAGLAFICLLAVSPCAAEVITVHGYHPDEPAIITSTITDCSDNKGDFCFHDEEASNSIIDGFTASDSYTAYSDGGYSGHTIAWNPKPKDGAELVAADADLRWSPGDYADAHDVYFGTDFNDVNEGNPGAYKDNQSQATYDPCILEFGRTYYWRIDEVNDANTYTWKGDVWSFTVWDGPLPCPAGDLVEDCRIDLDDLQVFMEQWLDEGGCSEPNCADLNDDLVVDFNDFAILAAGWRYKMIIAAHRDSAYTAPENTLAAFNLAWQQDADAVELDVHLSKDNRVMVIHDETTGRTAWGGIDLRVKDTNSDELRSLDVGRCKGDPNEKIPFLEEVIDTVPPGKQLFVEIKCGTDVLQYVKQIFEDSGKKNQMVVIGFNFDTLVSSKQLMPDVPTYLLVYGITDEQQKAYWVQRNENYGLDGLDAHYGMVTDIFIRTVRSAGQGLYTWTVNDPDTANYLKELGVDGITTDRPDWLMEHLE